MSGFRLICSTKYTKKTSELPVGQPTIATIISAVLGAKIQSSISVSIILGIEIFSFVFESMKVRKSNKIETTAANSSDQSRK